MQNNTRICTTHHNTASSENKQLQQYRESKSALHRVDVSAVVGFLVSTKEGPSRNIISVATTTGLLLS